MKGMVQLQSGVESCQRALDYIKANPGQHTMQIAEAMGWTPDATVKRLMRMADRGEIKRTPMISERIRCDGKFSAQRSFIYFALVDFTHSAEQLLELARENPAPPRVKKQPDPPWITRNTRFDDQFAKPYKGQGGQGTIGVRPRGVCSILGE